jgi:isopentenyl-diphosphate delta-isomerase
VAAAARRRLREEMGFECDLTPAFAFTYRADVGGGLVEHELDHVFVGRWDDAPTPDPEEVDGWRWASLDELARDATARPDAYTPWLRTILADPDRIASLCLRASV